MRLATVAWVCLAMTSFFVGTSEAGMIIDTTPGWNGSDYVSPLGQPANSSFGQTFTVTDGYTKLESFTFWLNDVFSSVYPDFTDFRAYVMAWDDSQTRASGSVLWSSDPMSTTNNHGSGGMEQFAFTTGGVELTNNAQYVAFLNTSLSFDALNNQAQVGARYTNPYSGGKMVYQNGGANFSAVTTSSWTVPSSEYDAAFRATFSAPPSPPLPPSPAAPVPEPGAVLAILSLVGTGGAAIAVRRRRRR